MHECNAPFGDKKIIQLELYEYPSLTSNFPSNIYFLTYYELKDRQQISYTIDFLLLKYTVIF